MAPSARRWLTLLAGLALLAPHALASHPIENSTHDSVKENTSAMKSGIIEVIAQWVPLVILFLLIGAALSALGINLFRSRL